MEKLSNLNILIIDDISTIRNLLTKQLGSLGIKNIHSSDSIIESWNLIHDQHSDKSQKIDIVFCDWNMPKGDGIDLLTKLRSSDDEQIRYIKFVMITGAKDKVKMAIDHGAHSIIHKPFKAEDIKAKIELIYGQSFK